MLNRRNVDKEIIDKGWDEMSLMLDAEMPVVRKSRRGLIFWLWGIFFLGIIGAFTWYNLSGNRIEDHDFLTPLQLQSESIPIVQSDSETPESINEISRDLGNSKGNEDVLIKRSNNNEKNESLNFNPSISKDSPKPEVREDLVNIIEKVIEQRVEAAKNEDNFTESGLSDESPSNEPGDTSFEDRHDRIILNINRLPLSIDALTWNRPFQNDLKIEPLIESSMNPWMVYLNSRLLQYEHFNLELGTGYELKLSSRFSFIPQVGFGWDKVDYRQAESQNRAVEFSSANGLDSDRFISNLRRGVKGNYLSLSLDASYRIIGNWHINSGLNYRLPSDAFNNGSDELAFEDNSTDPSAEMSGSSTINSNHDLFMRIGVSNRINRKFTIGFYLYSQLNDPYDVLVNGIKDDQATSSFFPRRKSLNIFMVYRF